MFEDPPFPPDVTRDDVAADERFFKKGKREDPDEIERPNEAKDQRRNEDEEARVNIEDPPYQNHKLVQITLLTDGGK